jgi:hypothetical protein
MKMLTWKRTKVEVPFLNGTRDEIRHTTTMPNGKEFSLRKADDIFFLYIDGTMQKDRIYFSTLKAGKDAVQRSANVYEQKMARA